VKAEVTGDFEKMDGRLQPACDFQGEQHRVDTCREGFCPHQPSDIVRTRLPSCSMVPSRFFRRR
jgi:hypothetical protein